MKRSDDPLSRLIRRAKQQTVAEPVDVPFGFSGRVVANWRAAERGKTEDFWLPALRRCVLPALGLMLISLWLNLKTPQPIWDPQISAAEQVAQLMNLQ